MTRRQKNQKKNTTFRLFWPLTSCPDSGSKIQAPISFQSVLFLFSSITPSNKPFNYAETASASWVIKRKKKEINVNVRRIVVATSNDQISAPAKFSIPPKIHPTNSWKWNQKKMCKYKFNLSPRSSDYCASKGSNSVTKSRFCGFYQILTHACQTIYMGLIQIYLVQFRPPQYMLDMLQSITS